MARYFGRNFFIAIIATVAVAVGAGLARAELSSTETKEFPANQDAGLTNEQREAKYENLRGEHDQRYVDWLDRFLASGQKAEDLERTAIAALYVEPEPDLSTAVTKADAILVGVVESVTYEPYRGALLTIKVVDSVKGDLDKSIQVRQSSFPYPDGTYDAEGRYAGGVLYAAGNEIPLFPGDRALLFLQKLKDDFYPQSFTGTYLIEGGTVARALEENPFHHDLQGKGESQAISLVRTKVSR